MFPPASRPFGRCLYCVAIGVFVASTGLWAGCRAPSGPLKHSDQSSLTIYQQLAHREIASDRLYRAVVDQADVEGFGHQLEVQSDLASPLAPADLERIKPAFEGSLKVMLFDLAPANFWEQHLAEYYAGMLSIEEAQTLVDGYDTEILHASSRLQDLRQGFVAERFPNLLPVVRARSQMFEISSVTMVPTLLPGDHVIVNRAAYHAAGPQRGDVVLYRYPDEEGRRFVHRVIGLPEDRIEIRTQVLSVNGEVATEPHVQHTDPSMVPGNVRDHLGPMPVPPDTYFVLGDNREESLDSRFLGSISKAQLLGQVVFVYWSVDHGLRSPRWDRLNRPVQ